MWKVSRLSEKVLDSFLPYAKENPTLWVHLCSNSYLRTFEHFNQKGTRIFGKIYDVDSHLVEDKYKVKEKRNVNNLELKKNICEGLFSI